MLFYEVVVYGLINTYHMFPFLVSELKKRMSWLLIAILRDHYESFPKTGRAWSPSLQVVCVSFSLISNSIGPGFLLFVKDSSVPVIFDTSAITNLDILHIWTDFSMENMLL